MRKQLWMKEIESKKIFEKTHLSSDTDTKTGLWLQFHIQKAGFVRKLTHNPADDTKSKSLPNVFLLPWPLAAELAYNSTFHELLLLCGQESCA